MRKESTDASNPLRALGTVLCEEEEGRSIYVPPFLKYAYVQETPMLVEGNLLKNLLLGNTPNQLPCPRSQSRLRASASASADVCMHVSAWGTFDCVSGRARGVGACRGWCICLSLLSLASRSMRVSQSPVCASAMECGLMCSSCASVCRMRETAASRRCSRMMDSGRRACSANDSPTTMPGRLRAGVS